MLEPHLLLQKAHYPVKSPCFQSPNRQQTSPTCIACALGVNMHVVERGGSQVSQRYGVNAAEEMDSIGAGECSLYMMHFK